MAHSYNVDSFRCGCEFCAPVPAADRKFEPAQDPRLWHRPVANGRHPLVLDRCFTFEKQNAFICRHVHAPWINCYSFKPPEGYDSDADDPDDKGEFVKPRRTSRATTTVDAKIVSGLFDRTTLPDECFKKVVSYMGSLEPRRPWRKAATRANWKRGDVLT